MRTLLAVLVIGAFGCGSAPATDLTNFGDAGWPKWCCFYAGQQMALVTACGGPIDYTTHAGTMCDVPIDQDASFGQSGSCVSYDDGGVQPQGMGTVTLCSNVGH